MVENCRFVRFDHLEFRFGGEQTIRVETSDDVLFDHVRVFAGSEASGWAETTSGGVPSLRGARRDPSWMFRSDIKDGYCFKVGTPSSQRPWARNEPDTVPRGRKDVDTVVHNCEFVDGHDLALFGQGTRFHHNWIHNLNDDALIVDIEGTSDLEIAQNVIMRCLDAISFARR